LTQLQRAPERPKALPEGSPFATSFDVAEIEELEESIDRMREAGGIEDVFEDESDAGD
jgi:hypothetical protein